MVDKFRPESPRAKIARAVEVNAGVEFGPARLTREKVATALNLAAKDISDPEWAEISEFAVNAGAALRRSIISKDVPADPNFIDARSMRKRIGKNVDKLLPAHDIFHAAETYRLTKGRRADSLFTRLSGRERYTNPELCAAELYPVLFFTMHGMSHPVPIVLATAKDRIALRSFSSPLISEVLGRPIPREPRDRQREYEAFLEAGLIDEARFSIPDLSEEEIKIMREGLKRATDHPPEHYARFSARVFAEEWRTNPRLFLDEFLSCIRTQPE